MPLQQIAPGSRVSRISYNLKTSDQWAKKSGTSKQPLETVAFPMLPWWDIGCGWVLYNIFSHLDLKVSKRVEQILQITELFESPTEPRESICKVHCRCRSRAWCSCLRGLLGHLEVLLSTQVHSEPDTAHTARSQAASSGSAGTKSPRKSFVGCWA